MPPPMVPTLAVPVERQRLSLDLAPSVSLLLDHVSTVTGTPKSQLVMQALLEALPELLERADSIDKRAAAMRQRPQGGKR